MNLNEYQYKARETAFYPNVGNNPIYPTLGLVGESGEVAEKQTMLAEARHCQNTRKNRTPVNQAMRRAVEYQVWCPGQ